MRTTAGTLGVSLEEAEHVVPKDEEVGLEALLLDPTIRKVVEGMAELSPEDRSIVLMTVETLKVGKH